MSLGEVAESTPNDLLREITGGRNMSFHRATRAPSFHFLVDANHNEKFIAAGMAPELTNAERESFRQGTELGLRQLSDAIARIFPVRDYYLFHRC